MIEELAGEIINLQIEFSATSVSTTFRTRCLDGRELLHSMTMKE